MLSLAVIGINVSELSKQFVVLGTILFLLITWSVAIIGASSRSRNLIAFTIVLWVIFIVMWLVLSLYFRLLNHNTHYCVADKKRCAPSMWLIAIGSSNDTDDDTGDEDEDEDGDEETTEEELKSKYGRRLWSNNNSPEITVKLVHPTRKYEMTNSVAVTLVGNTVVSNQRSITIDVNNGSKDERNQRTTTESPPRDLRMRAMEYRKNMTMYRQTAIQHRKKKGKKKKADDEESEGDQEGEDEEEENDEEEEKDNGDDKADSHTIDWLSMSGYLLLYLYALYVLLSYHSELKLMSICECDDNLGPRNKVP
ncbi:transcriptional regulator ATRX-like [Rhopalosiphum maidis]|uniref:transcriptional regulator ATRX-like n=1 Tax=Rhopalosiphum maidis TaxID=43146 RepID=UPI000EFE3A14|nr:transcriptional regulator ATRX-like [Rhopalosiphum maidis]